VPASSAAGNRGACVSPRPMKERAMPHIGRDAVKIESPDGVAHLRRAGTLARREKTGD
jgi:hypothetical protein